MNEAENNTMTRPQISLKSRQPHFRYTCTHLSSVLNISTHIDPTDVLNFKFFFLQFKSFGYSRRVLRNDYSGNALAERQFHVVVLLQPENRL